MLAPPQAAVEVAGFTVHIRPPDTALDVLEVDVFITAQIHEHMERLPRAQDLRALQAWVAEHVVAVEGTQQSWGALTERERVDWIDTELDYPQLVDLKKRIIELASLPERLVDDVQEFWRIAALGGCECPICKHDKEPTPALLKVCLYAKLGEATDRVVAATAKIGEAAALNAPWWLYQLQQAQAIGRGRARQEEKRGKDRKKSIHEAIKARGGRL